VQLLGVAAAGHAVFRARTAQGAIAWALSLVTFPWLALPLYLVFGRNKFAGYARSRRAGSLKINRLAEDAVAKVKQFRCLPTDPVSGAVCEAAERLVGLPVTSANKIRLLPRGSDAFDVMLQAIAQARDYVLVQFFIVANGHLSEQYKQILSECARRGVRVYFLYDEVGSRKLSRRYVRELAEAGIGVSSFHSTRGRGNQFQLNFRNHRKVTVVDGHTAFVGGLNLSDEYVGRSRRFRSGWRDTHVSIAGPSVQCLQLAFLEDWHWATGEMPELCWTPRPVVDTGQTALILPTGPADELETCQLFVLHAIQAARERIWIASPYFVPGPGIVAALQLAAVRGVDVRILLPGVVDHWLAYFAAFSYYPEMLAAGVRLYSYQHKFMHQKVILVDRELAAVGTVNLDNRSFHLNFEMTVLVADRQFADEVAGMLSEDFEHSQAATAADLDQRGFLFRLAAQVSRLLAPIL
jgi:cardiolipin synthase